MFCRQSLNFPPLTMIVAFCSGAESSPTFRTGEGSEQFSFLFWKYKFVSYSISTTFLE